MRIRILVMMLGLLSSLLISGCAQHHSGVGVSLNQGARLTAAGLPPLEPGKLIEPGILFNQVRLVRGGSPMVLWIYTPERHSSHPLPCVFIAPAGSRLFHGEDLGESDMPEHLPYARAGFCVVAYSLDGPLARKAMDTQVLPAARAFRQADAGLANFRAALDYSLARIPNIDPKRLYVAGHSSAATASLLVAENEPKIAACIAYAPVCSITPHLKHSTISALDRALPGYADFLLACSPDFAPEKLRCPVFLFHSNEDTVVPTEDNTAFATKLQRTNHKVTFMQAARGSHYESMVQMGIPEAIKWLKNLPTN